MFCNPLRFSHFLKLTSEFSSSSIFQHFHVNLGCVSSDFGGICGCCLLSTGGFGGRLQFGGSDIEEVLRYRDGYCLLSGEAININGLTRLPKLLYEIKTF